MDAIKDELIKRATDNGRKSAEHNFNHNFAESRSYQDNTIELARAYPMFSQEIRSAHSAAYAEFYKTHKH